DFVEGEVAQRGSDNPIADDDIAWYGGGGGREAKLVQLQRASGNGGQVSVSVGGWAFIDECAAAGFGDGPITVDDAAGLKPADGVKNQVVRSESDRPSQDERGPCCRAFEDLRRFQRDGGIEGVGEVQIG